MLWPSLKRKLQVPVTDSAHVFLITWTYVVFSATCVETSNSTWLLQNTEGKWNVEASHSRSGWYRTPPPHTCVQRSHLVLIGCLQAWFLNGPMTHWQTTDRRSVGQDLGSLWQEGSCVKKIRETPPHIHGRWESNPIISTLTWDIWGLKLISFRSTDPGERLCNIWHRRTPSRRACARSKTAAEGHTTRWFRGRTLQSINHRPHCLHSSMAAPGDVQAK